MSNQDLISEYLSLVSDTEVPAIFHRWAIMAGIGAMFGRNIWFDAGIDKIYPNLYVMLVGRPGVKKSTAIKIMRKFLSASGYTAFSASRTSKEQFLGDLAAGLGSVSEEESLLDQNIFGDMEDYTSLSAADNREVFIVADEFNNFFGNNILDFVSLLGELWDYNGQMVVRAKHSDPVVVPNPTVSILCGNTPETIFNTFPPAVIGQGFFSRLIFVHSDGNNKSVPFPTPLGDELVTEFAKLLSALKDTVRGEVKLDSEAKSMLEKIYSKPVHIPDPRFDYYSTRRFAQLQKLCMIHAVADCSTVILPEHVKRANTVLTYTEYGMPDALGSLGRAKNSEVQYKLLNILKTTKRSMTSVELWPMFMNDLGTTQELSNVLNNLILARKILNDGKGFSYLSPRRAETEGSLYDWEYMTDEEREGVAA